MVLPFFDYLDILIDGSRKMYSEKLQRLQFRGIKIIYQYNIDGRKITNTDEAMLHTHLNLSYLEHRRKRHLLNMMYTLVSRRQDLLKTRNLERTLRSDRTILFDVDMVASELYGKSPYIRGNHLWKQLHSDIHHAKNKQEFNAMLTEDIIANLKV